MTSEVPGSSWVCWWGPGGHSDAFGVVGAVLVADAAPSPGSAESPAAPFGSPAVPGELLQLNHGTTEVRKDTKITKSPHQMRTDRVPKPANEPPRSSPCPAQGGGGRALLLAVSSEHQNWKRSER